MPTVISPPEKKRLVDGASGRAGSACGDEAEDAHGARRFQPRMGRMRVGMKRRPEAPFHARGMSAPAVRRRSWLALVFRRRPFQCGLVEVRVGPWAALTSVVHVTQRATSRTPGGGRWSPARW